MRMRITMAAAPAALCLALATATAATSSKPALTPTPPRLAATAPALGGVALQVALDRAGFSPGVIDGRPGARTRLALAEYVRVYGAPPTLPTAAITRQSVTAADVRGVTGVTPKSWNERAKLRELGYADLTDALAERFHCTRGYLIALNPGVDLRALRPGDGVMAPAIDTTPPATPVARIEISLSEKVVRGYSASGRQTLLLHCSIARDKAKRPSGSATVAAVAVRPAYTFDPALWPEVTDVDRKLLIPPGPRGPVGMAWVGLSLAGYGIHGTPTPELIGKTGSHGCFRLANWDAVRLARSVRPGAVVTFRP